MNTLHRVVWSEGMHLAQHHFQAQARYFENLVSFAVNSLYFAPHGFTALELDAEALLNGTVVLLHARGVLPDGLAFAFPEDEPPAPLEVRERFSPTQESHVVYLGVPAYRRDRANCSGSGMNGAEPRYRSVEQAVFDETTGTDAKNIGIARKNFRLLLDDEVTENLVTLPVARIRRDGSGHFVYDGSFIPPVLQISASSRIQELLGRLVGVLEAKAEALASERAGGIGSIGQRGSSEIASFWLSHAVHSGIAPLRHHLFAGQTHPERLYGDLVRLAGALCTFSMTSHPRDLPIYDHDKLDHVFELLDRHIREHLDVIIPTNCVTIDLTRSDENLHTGSVTDRRCFHGAEWYLAVRSSASTADLLARVPKLVKICSARYIVRLVKEAYPGLTLEHVQSPPTSIPIRPATQYFRVHRTGPCWESIVSTAQVGVYVPDAIPDSDFELLVVLPDTDN